MFGDSDSAAYSFKLTLVIRLNVVTGSAKQHAFVCKELSGYQTSRHTHVVRAVLSHVRQANAVPGDNLKEAFMNGHAQRAENRTKDTKKADQSRSLVRKAAFRI